MMKFLLILQLTIVFCLLTTEVYAYIDPATGSMIIQMLIGAMAGAYLFFRNFWSRIRDFLGGAKRDRPLSREVDALKTESTPQRTLRVEVLDNSSSQKGAAALNTPETLHGTRETEVFEETHSSKDSASS